jgi:hypothetical protein
MSMRKWSAWAESIEREHLTEFGVNRIAVDYGHDFDTTTKAPSSTLSNLRFTNSIATCFIFSTLDDPRIALSLTVILCAPRGAKSRACPLAEVRDRRANIDTNNSLQMCKS